MVNTRRSSFSVPSLPSASASTPLKKGRRVRASPSPASHSVPASPSVAALPPRPRRATTASKSKETKAVATKAVPVRPPRVPSVRTRSSPVVSSVAAAATTTNEPVARSPIKTRSESTTNVAATNKDPATNKDHFLQGINLDHCQDLLSIPDPPSPDAAVRQRRMSMPLLRPFRDVSNSSDPSPLCSSPSKTKPSRKSLGHVASPLLPLDDSVTTEKPTLSIKPTVAVEKSRSLSSNKMRRKSACHVPSPIAIPKKPSSSGRGKEAKQPHEPKLDLSSLDHDNDTKKPLKKRHSMFLPRGQTSEQQVLSIHTDNTLESRDGKRNDDFSLDLELDLGGIDEPVKRNKKRQSMFLPRQRTPRVVSKEEEDLVPPESSISAFGLEDETVEVPVPNKRAKKRQSMYLPRPSAIKDERVVKDELVSQQTNDKDNQGLMDVEFSPVQSKVAASSSTRTRKRQSILLPCDLTAHTDESEYFQKLLKYDTTPPPKFTSNCNSTDETKQQSSHLNEMDMIREMAREYCALPMSKRATSYQAQEIERLSGYPLVPPRMKKQMEAASKTGSDAEVDLNWNGSPADNTRADSMELKRDMLLTLAPAVQQMDKRKLEEVAKMQSLTECRVEKSRSGKFRYYHMLSNKRILPNEYQQRYFVALKESKGAMQARIHAFHEQCRQTGGTAGFKSSCEDGSFSGVSDLKSNKGKASEEETSGVGGDSMDLDESMDVDNSLLLSLGEEQQEGKDKKASAKGIGSEEGEDKPTVEEEAPMKRDDYMKKIVMPLPSRDSRDEDPDIAAAQQKLWVAIDAALEVYTGEVVAVRAARKIGKGEKTH